VGVPPTEENFKKFLGNVPLGRLTSPTDVANYCLFLASDEAKFITGTCLEIDGGRGI
jgi:NAD(P)-dependent dehydrogenase (short-subunit alcohol dehydrogenase family)